MRQRLHHERRARQQHKGQRNLEYDQSVSNFEGAADASRATLLQGLNRSDSRRAARRHKTREQTSDQRTSQRKPQQRPIRGDFSQSRRARRGHYAKRLYAQSRDATPNGSAEQREQATFHQALPPQSTRRRTEGRAHGHLALPSPATRQKETRQIGASDQ